VTVSSIPRLLTVANVAELAQVSEWTVRKEIECGALKARRIRGCVRILDTDFDKWCEREAS
jgi:excisionase family DNA binding protein